MSKYQATLHDVLKEPKTNNFMRLPERVARTEIGDLCISTVNLGYLDNTNANVAGAAPFETCVFYPDDTSNVLHRCTTRQEALQYHVRIVQHEINHIVEHLRNLPTQAVTNDSLRI